MEFKNLQLDDLHFSGYHKCRLPKEMRKVTGANESNSTNSPINKGESYSPNKSCTQAIGISCIVLLLIIAGLTYWLYTIFKKNPSMEYMGECMMNMGQISGALDRYKQKKGEYPQKLEDLYPNFLEDISVLHCPSDSSPINKPSYEYEIPNKKDPPDTIVVCCKRHKIMNTEMWLCVQKNGKLRTYTIAPDKSDKPIPGLEIDPKTLQQ